MLILPFPQNVGQLLHSTQRVFCNNCKNKGIMQVTHHIFGTNPWYICDHSQECWMDWWAHQSRNLSCVHLIAILPAHKLW